MEKNSVLMITVGSANSPPCLFLKNTTIVTLWKQELSWRRESRPLIAC